MINDAATTAVPADKLSQMVRFRVDNDALYCMVWFMNNERIHLIYLEFLTFPFFLLFAESDCTDVVSIAFILVDIISRSC